MPDDQTKSETNTQPMHCIGCGYSLNHLDRHRCPECGREFDRSNPSTFQPNKRRVLPFWLAVFIIAGAAYLPALVILAPKGLWIDVPSVLTPRGFVPHPFDPFAVFGTLGVIMIASSIGKRDDHVCAATALFIALASVALSLWIAAWARG